MDVRAHRTRGKNQPYKHPKPKKIIRATSLTVRGAHRVQIPANCRAFFTQPIVVLNQAALQRAPWAHAQRDAAAMINAMGDRSARAQGLVGHNNRPNPITQAHTLSETNARLYLLAQAGPSGAPLLVGLLKVGHKQLYHFDGNGRTHELRLAV